MYNGNRRKSGSDDMIYINHVAPSHARMKNYRDQNMQDARTYGRFCA